MVNAKVENCNFYEILIYDNKTIVPYKEVLEYKNTFEDVDTYFHVLEGSKRIFKTPQQSNFNESELTRMTNYVTNFNTDVTLLLDYKEQHLHVVLHRNGNINVNSQIVVINLTEYTITYNLLVNDYTIEDILDKGYQVSLNGDRSKQIILKQYGLNKNDLVDIGYNGGFSDSELSFDGFSTILPKNKVSRILFMTELFRKKQLDENWLLKYYFLNLLIGSIVMIKGDLIEYTYPQDLPSYCCYEVCQRTLNDMCLSSKSPGKNEWLLPSFKEYFPKKKMQLDDLLFFFQFYRIPFCLLIFNNKMQVEDVLISKSKPKYFYLLFNNELKDSHIVLLTNEFRYILNKYINQELLENIYDDHVPYDLWEMLYNIINKQNVTFEFAIEIYKDNNGVGVLSK